MDTPITTMICLSLAILALLARPIYADETIVLSSEGWCPYACNPRQDYKLGFLTEIALEALATQKIQVDYQIIPYPRAIKLTRDGKQHGMLGVYREDVPDFVFPDRAMAVSVKKFFTRSGNEWRYQGPAGLLNIQKLAVMEGYDYAEANDFINQNPNKVNIIVGQDPLTRALDMLVYSRHEVIADDELAVRFRARQKGLTTKIREAGILGEPNPVYLAFSPSHAQSKIYAKALLTGIEEIQKQGRIEKILAKYEIPSQVILPLLTK